MFSQAAASACVTVRRGLVAPSLDSLCIQELINIYLELITYPSYPHQAAIRSQGSSGRRLAHLYDDLARVPSFEQVLEAAGTLLDSVADIVGVFELALFDELGEVADGLWELLGVVKVEESLDDGALDDDARVVLDAVGLLPLLVEGRVGADGSAGDHSALLPDVHQHFVEHLPAHVVEVHVDSLGEALAEPLLQRLLLVVDHVVCPQRLHVGAFVSAASYPAHLAPCQLCQLHCDFSHRSRSRAHHHFLSRLQLADLLEAEVGGESCHSEHSQEVFELGVCGGEKGECFFVEEGVFLPVGDAEHAVAHFELGAVGEDDLCDAEALHEVSGIDGRHVALHSRNPHAVGGVDGDEQIAHHHLALLHAVGRHWRHVRDLENVLLGGVFCGGPLAERDLRIEVHLRAAHINDYGMQIISMIMGCRSGQVEVVGLGELEDLWAGGGLLDCLVVADGLEDGEAQAESSELALAQPVERRDGQLLRVHLEDQEGPVVDVGLHAAQRILRRHLLAPQSLLLDVLGDQRHHLLSQAAAHVGNGQDLAVVGSAEEVAGEVARVFGALAAVGAHDHEIELDFGDAGVSVGGEPAFELLPVAPALVGEVEVLAALQDQSLVVPPQHLPEKLEYLSPLFWKMNYPVLCPPEDAAFGNQLASLQQRLPQQVLPVLLQHIENVDEQPLSGSHFFLPCLALGAALLLEFVEGERGFSACFHQYDFSVDFEAVEGGALELVEDGLVERAIIGVLGLAVAAEHLQLLTALVADHGAFPVVLDVQQQRALLLEAELVQICLGNQRACQHVPEIVQVVIAFSLLRLSLFDVAVLLNYLRLLTLLCLAYLNL